MKKTKKRNSLSAKTVSSTIKSCILFGLVTEIIAISFSAFSLTKQYIQTADTTVKQVRMSAMHSADPCDYSKQVMSIYQSLTDEQLGKVGTDEYRSYFSDVDTTTKGGVYDVMIHMLSGTQSFHTQNDISDIYLAMYDERTSAMVYIIDPDKEASRLMPGDWEAVNRKGMMKFLEGKNDEILYDIGWTKNYGLLCTVGVPLQNEKGTYAFMLADI